jgi:hypothetical protein
MWEDMCRGHFYGKMSKNNKRFLLKSIYLYFSLVSIKKGGDIYSRRRIESILGGE